MKKLGIYAGVGAAAGATTFLLIGGMGIAITGTAFGIGLVGMSVIGASAAIATKSVVDSVKEYA
jgi:hypothetical protein